MQIINNNIDALRGVAVILVFLFHVQLFNYGFIGVDIFFCISGFLITGSLLRSLRKNLEHSIVDFYEKRILRIIPPLIPFYIISTFVSYLLILDSERINFIKSSIFSLFFIGNIYNIYFINYFSISNEFNPFCHLWSLSIEEQFYLFIAPLLLYSFTKKNNIIIIILLALSFLLFLISTKINSNIDYVYPNTIFRGWELLSGVITRLYCEKKQKEFRFNTNYLILISLIFFAAISFFGFPISEVYLWQIQTVLVTSLTVLFLIFSNSRYECSRVLRPLHKLGRLSYGFYLYHYPIIVFFKWHFGTLNFKIIFFIFILIYILSYISYTYYESYFFKETSAITSKRK